MPTAHQLQEGGDPVEQDAAAERPGGGRDEGLGAWRGGSTSSGGGGGLVVRRQDHQGVRAVADGRLVLPPGQRSAGFFT